MTQDHSLCTQAAAALEKLKVWLGTYPGWDGCLLPQSVEEISRREDVLGNSLVGCRYRVALYWQTDGDSCEEENAQRLLAFQHWVQEQSALGLAPRLGDVPARERLRTEKGGFTPGAQTVTYTITLIADFMKVYEVK